MGQQPVITLIGGPFDGQTLQVSEALEYFKWAHGSQEVTYVQSSFPFHYYFHAEEQK